MRLVKKQILMMTIILLLLNSGMMGCIERFSENAELDVDQIIVDVCLTTDKDEYVVGEQLTLTFTNNKEHSIYNQGGPLPTPSPIKSYSYWVQSFSNNSWIGFPLVRGNRSKYCYSSVIQVVVDCIEYSSNSTKTQKISLSYFVYGENNDYYVDFPAGRYRIIKNFYNDCIDDFSVKNWSESFSVYSNEFTIVDFSENISSIEYLFNHSSAFEGEKICLRGIVFMDAPICTAMMCPPDNPCCNACSPAVLMIYDETGMIKTSRICGVSECDLGCDPFEMYKTYKITGNWTNEILEIISFEMIIS